VLRFAAIELAIWAAVYGTYLAVRGLTMGAPHEAFAHASEVIDVERAVGLFHEAGFQHYLAPAADAFSTYYMLGFGPLIGFMAVWLGLRRRALYKEFRNALLLSVAMATVIFALFPTAPPRLVTGLGIADTVGLSSHDTGSFMGIRFNPYAAVPSMHVGWSLVVAVIGFRAVRRRWLKAFFVVHPILMAATVTATGNHYFFDSIGGATVAGLTLLLLRLRRPTGPAPLRVLEGGAPSDDRAARTSLETERRAA
jgi:hypothetical protein